MRLYWLIWEVPKDKPNFELLWPWWHYPFGVSLSVCGVIMSVDEPSAREVIYQSYDERPEKLDFIAIEERDAKFVRDLHSRLGAFFYATFIDKSGVRSDKELQSNLFPKLKWMPDFDDVNFDPVNWTARQDAAATASKKRHRHVLDRNEEDRLILSEDLPGLVARGGLVDDMSDILQEAVSKARTTDVSTSELLDNCIDMVARQLGNHPGYVTMEERGLFELELGTFILPGRPSPSEIYLKTRSGCLTLDGHYLEIPLQSDTRVIPVRLIADGA